MASKTDRLTDFYDAVGRLRAKPWKAGGEHAPDFSLLERLIQVAVDTGRADKAQTGGVALAVDVWVASELRRAGLDPDAVWPRATLPRVLPPRVASATDQFKLASKRETRQVQERAVDQIKNSAGAGKAQITGGQFIKEVDVVMADYDTGLELAVSTKAMTDSYGKNITNRWEEASGDLLNIRRRFPLAAFGFAFLVTRPILDEANSWDRAKDMLRKLTTFAPGAEGTAYDAGCLIVADWPKQKVRLHMDEVPDDLSPSTFFDSLLRALFTRSPVVYHEHARDRWLASSPSDAPF